MDTRKPVLLCTVAAALLIGLLHLAPDRVEPASSRRHFPAVKAAAPDPAPRAPISPSPQAPEVSDFPAITLAPVLPEADSPATISHWQGRLVTPLREHAPAPDADLHLPLYFAFPLSATRQIRVRIDRHDETGLDSGVFTGEAEGHPGSVVILSHVGLAQAGVVQLPEERRSFVINGDETGRIRITACDLDRAPGCTPPLTPPSAHSRALASIPTSTP